MSLARSFHKTAHGIAPYLYLAPALTVLAIFVVAPVFYALYLSFTDWDLISPVIHIVGVANYQRLAADPNFWGALRNTILYAIGLVPAQFFLALGVAVLLNSKIRLRSLFRAIYFLPVIVPITVTATVWLFIFSPSFGILNYLLNLIGLPGIGWLSDPNTALPSLIVLSVWTNFGYFTVIFLAALQSVPAELLEAAALDGANRWQGFWKVTFPLLGPTSFLVLILSVIGAFQVYQTVVLTTQGGPAGATNVIVFYLYRNAFEFFNMGYAAAIAIVLFVVLFVLTLLQFKLIGSRIYYS